MAARRERHRSRLVRTDGIIDQSVGVVDTKPPTALIARPVSGQTVGPFVDVRPLRTSTPALQPECRSGSDAHRMDVAGQLHGRRD
jgi:hypothetical protein